MKHDCVYEKSEIPNVRHLTYHVFINGMFVAQCIRGEFSSIIYRQLSTVRFISQAHASLIMTASEFQTVENLLRACAANTEHCRKVLARASALVNRAKKLIQFSQEHLRSKNAWTSKNPFGSADGRPFLVDVSTKTGKSNDAEPTVLNP